MIFRCTVDKWSQITLTLTEMSMLTPVFFQVEVLTQDISSAWIAEVQPNVLYHQCTIDTKKGKGSV